MPGWCSLPRIDIKPARHSGESYWRLADRARPGASLNNCSVQGARCAPLEKARPGTKTNITVFRRQGNRLRQQRILPGQQRNLPKQPGNLPGQPGNLPGPQSNLPESDGSRSVRGNGVLKWQRSHPELRNGPLQRRIPPRPPAGGR